MYEKRVVVAMSGGVDSSVAAALLVEQGYEVVGVMARLWAEGPASNQQQGENRCCAPQAVDDARRVASLLGIPFYLLNLETVFKSCVVSHFTAEYARGRTPNPCVVCNKQVRFGRLMEHALALGAAHLVTGHYARIEQSASTYRLLKGVDSRKDQSYMLYTLDQDQLSHTLFPVGGMTKSEVRSFARQRRLPVADRSESMDLCFVRDGDYRRFLQEHSPASVSPGPVLNAGGREIGRHRGLAFYTVGQRSGIGIAASAPLYVLCLDAGRNAVVVGPAEALERQSLRVSDAHYPAGKPPCEAIPTVVKIRSQAVPAPAVWKDTGARTALIEFDRPVRAVSPGQSAVAYQGDVVLGGGIICE